MPYKDPEKRRECQKKYYEKNKIKIKQYRLDNKEKLKETNKKYYENNRTERILYSKFWHQNHKRLHAEHTQKYREKNKDKIKNRRIFRKLKVYGYYSNNNIECNCCGEKHIDFLSLDHIYDNGSLHRKKSKITSGTKLIDWIIKNNFPPIFQILCMNCNFAKGKDKIEHLCPHQKERSSQILNETLTTF